MPGGFIELFLPWLFRVLIFTSTVQSLKSLFSFQLPVVVTCQATVEFFTAHVQLNIWPKT